MKKPTIKIKYPPLQKIRLISGTEMYINSVTIYSDYHTYSVWDGGTIFINVDESQIVGVIG